jgi:parvulin-like peptidyl-prolyl isomerase
MTFRSARRLAAVIAALGAIAIGASGCGNNTLTDAATVSFRDSRGDQTVHISQDDLIARVEKSVDNPAFREIANQAGFKTGNGEESTDSTLTAFWLTQMINEAVIDAAYDAQGLQATDADRQAAQQRIQSQFGEQVFNAWPKELKDALVDSQAKLSAVLRNCPSGRVVYHILLRTEAAANQAYERIRKGESFETVAKDVSIDGSKQQGGLLGCVGPEQFVPEFQKVAETQAPGIVTRPVKTQFGYHLILVRDWDPKLADDEQLAQGAAQAASADLDARVAALIVKVDPRFGTWGAHTTQDGRQVFNVAAPAVPEPRNQREPTAPTTTLPLGQPAAG